MKAAIQISAMVIALFATCTTAIATQTEGTLVDLPELTITKLNRNISLAMPATEYADFTIDGNTVTYTITGYDIPAGHKTIGGEFVKRVSWEPGAAGTLVTVECMAEPLYSAINAMPGTELKPDTPHVIAGLGFAPHESRSIGSGGLGAGTGSHREQSEAGDYELPEMRDYKYSDVLVSLNVRNVDFREVLWLLSDIGGVSIMLDPYWADEPTGSRRPVGGGADPGSGGGGEGGPGFRSGVEFNPLTPREGTGDLTLNFESVPFDLALELVVMSVGLEIVEINPNDY
jgi:hypothetical protein